MFLKRLLLLFLTGFMCTPANAQFRYNFKDTTTAYVPLPANAVSLNGNLAWESENYVAPLPFPFVLDSVTTLNNLYLHPGGLVLIDTPFIMQPVTVSGFYAGGGSLADRGILTGGISQSPVRYLTTGTAPNRIFKVEIANAGYLDELDGHNTMEDFVNVQIWLYEGSNILEAHYGPSQMTYFAEHYEIAPGQPASALVSFFRDIETNTGQSGTYYFLQGTPAAPTLSTLVLPSSTYSGLTSWPQSGRVYRFTPKVKPSGINGLATPAGSSIFPNPATTFLCVEGVTAGTKATLYSMLGQPVLQTVLAGSQSLDIAHLPAGLYKLVLTDREGVSGATTLVKE